MKMKMQRLALVWIFAAMAAAVLLGPHPAAAHGDTLDGPVVHDAQKALEKGDVTPVLPWIRPADEQEIRQAFQNTLAARTKGAEALALADRYFFETLVRVHRAGEGAPFTGLKPAGTEVEPAIAAADQALERGSVDGVVDEATKVIAQGIRERYEKVAAAKAHKDESVAAGRKFVAAYVNFIHYVEGIHAAANSQKGPHGGEAEGHQAATGAAHPMSSSHEGHEAKVSP